MRSNSSACGAGCESSKAVDAGGCGWANFTFPGRFPLSVKIWILTSEIPPTVLGGIARYVHNFATALSEAGHAVTVFARIPENFTHPADLKLPYRVVTVVPRREPGVLDGAPKNADRHRAFPYNVMAFSPALSYQFSQVLERERAEQGEPDLIETQEYDHIGFFLLQRRLVERDFFRNVPVVLHLHTPQVLCQELNREPVYRLPNYWSGRLELACMHMADALLAPSEAMGRWVARRYPEVDKPVRAIPLPVDLGGIESYATLVTDPGEVAFFGRVEIRKGAVELVHAARQLWQGGAEFHLGMYGSDTFASVYGRSLVDQLSQKYRPEVEAGWLSFSGGLPYDCALRQVARASVVVVPSIWENFPNVCLEALALGKVIVAARSGGIPEIMGEGAQARFLFDPEVEGDLAAKLEQALALGEAERREAFQAGQARVRAICTREEVLRRRLAHFEAVRANFRPAERFPFSSPLPSRDLPDAPKELRGERGLVSVVTPFYNLGEFLPEAAEAYEAADYARKEWIIVDDGSTQEASVQALAELEGRRVPGLRIVRTRNGGLARARNRGAEAARGEYLVFLDGDDAFEPSFIPKAVEVFERYANVHLVNAWARFFGERDGIWPSWNLELPFLLAHNLMIPICSVRRQTFLEAARNDPDFCYGLEDQAAWIALLGAGYGGVSLPEPLVRYRVRESSMFRSISAAQYLYTHNLMAAKHPELYARFGGELYNLLNANGPAYLWDQAAAWHGPYDKIVRERDDAQARGRHERHLRTGFWEKSRHLEEHVHHLTSILEAKSKEAQWRRGQVEELEKQVERLRDELTQARSAETTSGSGTRRR